ncbi:MAG: hypothetical protein ACM3TR_08015 [Caulobacteraceae bacterium]
MKAQGKRIFVITHIPPQDPRSGVTPNEIPNYANQVESGESWVEQKLSDYNENKYMNHGFQDPQEAARFENLMSTYHVDTVYLSYIHSYLARYAATVQLFASAMYEENPVAVVFIIAGFVLLILLLVIKIYLREKQPLDTLWK